MFKFKKTNNKTKEILFVASILLIPLLTFAVFYVYQNFSSFLLAFQKIDLAGRRYFVGFDNFKEFFSGMAGNAQAGVSLRNSVKAWCINFSITIPLYLIFSYYIAKKMPFSKFVNFIVLVPQVVSTFLYSLVYIQFVENALPVVMNKLFNVVNFPNIIWNNSTAFANNLFFSIWLSFGTSVLVYSNAIRAIDNEIFESARLDGVNDVQEFFSIILPLIWPTLTTMVVTSVTGVFTWSGSLMVFYMYDAPPHIWGLDYFFTRTVKVSMGNGTEYLAYPTVATSGFIAMIFTAPIVFLVRYLMNKFDKTAE